MHTGFKVLVSGHVLCRWYRLLVLKQCSLVPHIYK